MDYQWYPGHMTKAMRQMKEDIKLIDLVIELLDAGNTVPFIARYRKEKTGGLDDVILRNFQERLTYLKN